VDDAVVVVDVVVGVDEVDVDVVAEDCTVTTSVAVVEVVLALPLAASCSVTVLVTLGEAELPTPTTTVAVAVCPDVVRLGVPLQVTTCPELEQVKAGPPPLTKLSPLGSVSVMVNASFPALPLVSDTCSVNVPLLPTVKLPACALWTVAAKLKPACTARGTPTPMPRAAVAARMPRVRRERMAREVST
jgi:hypothetical protein